MESGCLYNGFFRALGKRVMSGSWSDEQPIVSVIVVNWNTREMTLDCVDSLYRHVRGVPFELLLVDNGSTDGSAEAIAARFPQVRLFAEPVNHGFGAANNIAAREARGRYLLLLNSDTLLRDDAVSTLVRFAERTPNAYIWGGRTVFADGSLNIGSAWGAFTLWAAFCFATGLTLAMRRSELFNPEALGDWDRSTEREVDIVSGCFFLIERSWWEALNGFDPAFFMYGEEADLCARARLRGARPRVTPDATIVHHGEASKVASHDARLRITKAKVNLARRTMTPTRADMARRLLIAGTGLRAGAYRIAARVNGRLSGQAQIWGAVWRRRAEWT